MRKFRILCVILSLIFLLQHMSALARATQTDTSAGESVSATTEGSYLESVGDVAVTNGCHSLDGQMPLFGSGRYVETAAAAFLYEVNSDTVLYAWNPDAPMYPASLVKAMTALIAIENGNLDDVITVSEATVNNVKNEKIYAKLQVGQKVTLEQLIYCLLVGSENDAAIVIAEHIAGSQQAFVAMMNRRADELGCTGTNFVNAHGLHHENQITTARDMAKVFTYASKNEVFMKCFGTTAFTLPASDVSEERYMETTNLMQTPSTPQYYYKYVTGGRTGVDDDRKRCLAVTAQKDELSLVCVVLGAVPVFEEDGVTPVRFGSYEETKELLDLGFTDNTIMQVLGEGQVLTQYPVTNGSNAVAAGVNKSVSTVLPKGTTYNNLSVRYQTNHHSLEAPVASGEEITTVQIWYGNVCIASAPVIALNGSSKAVIDTADAGNASGAGSFSTAVQIILVIVALIIGTAGVLHIVQSIKSGALRAQYRKRRQSRRRTK